MLMSSRDDHKAQKKRAKAEAKAVKKRASTGDRPVRALSDAIGDPEADRSTRIAEKDLALNRWRVILAAVSALIALVSLIVLLIRS